ncbi:hypothetical protein [Tepidiphilus margaritifer]|uniref:hypothetical protein n=1 Tax=Tepidiphilus margaritifer TaxID=203471 RepID=UPI0003F8D3CA|nr:hypothetical protein [Tepidiphilus margaritifer]
MSISKWRQFHPATDFRAHALPVWCHDDEGTPPFFWVIDVVGLPDASMAGMNVLWVVG